MKSQKFFGGTSRQNPSAGDPTLNQVGHKSATPGVNEISNNRGQADRKAYKPKSGPFYRPTIQGKVDNRKVGQ